MGFRFLFDQGNRVLLVKYGRVLTPEVLEGVFAAARAFVGVHGDCPAIADFSAVEHVDVGLEFWRGLSRRARVMQGTKRVLVAPNDSMYGMIRMYGLHQASLDDEPIVVRTLIEAYAALGLSNPDFQPV